MKKMLLHYKLRDERLHAYGYKNYQEYLRSDEWRKVKQKHFEKEENRLCNICGSGLYINVHHTRYKCIGTLKTLYLVTLCDYHHQEVHKYQYKRNILLPTAMKKYRKAHKYGRVK